MIKRYPPWFIFHTIVMWILLPLAAMGVAAELMAGDSLHAITVATWGILVYASNREHRRWRQRTNRWTQLEKEDRDRFAADVLLMKSHVAQTYARRHASLMDDPDVRAGVSRLYEDVANTWLGEDAPQELHDLKAGARKIAESDDPRPHLRIVH